MRLNRNQKELAQYVKWDPSEEGLEPYTDINNTKVRKLFVEMVKDTPLGKRVVDAAEEGTLKEASKYIPMGNLFLWIMEKVTDDDLINSISGKKENGLYSYMLDSAEEYVKTLRSTQQELHDASQNAAEVELGGLGTLTLPDEASLTAINALLNRSKLPNLEDVFNELDTVGGTLADALNEVARAADKADVDAKDIDRLQAELRALAAKASISSAPIEIEHDGTIPSGRMVTKKMSELFPGVKMKTDFEVPSWEWDGDHPDVPRKDEHYIFRPEQLTRVIYAILTNQRAYLQGHTGSGKTTLIEQVAAHLNWPFVRINFDSEITRMDLIGRDTLTVNEDGTVSSKFVDGILPRVMSGAYIACFDEIDFVRPDVAYVMQAALEGNGLRITEDGDRLVRPNEMFRMFATGNTVGQGDEHGMYQGARPQSIALLDRFTIWAKVEYLSSDERKSLIERHFPGMDADSVKQLNQYTNEHLEAFTTAKVIQPISPRGILAVARAYTILGDMSQALHMTVLDRASEDDRATLKGIIDRVVS